MAESTSSMICTVADDDGVVCNREMTKREFDQDGMCWRCACAISRMIVDISFNNKDPGKFLHRNEKE